MALVEDSRLPLCWHYYSDPRPEIQELHGETISLLGNQSAYNRVAKCRQSVDQDLSQMPLGWN